MRIFYDTEFIDDGERIEFISIGMVTEDDRILYRVNNDIEVMRRADKNAWLRQNVLKYLPLTRDMHTGELLWDELHPDWSKRTVTYKDQIAKDIRAFCTRDGTPELWAWFAAYDHVVLSQLFGRMLDLPEDMPMYTMDIKQEHHKLGHPRLPSQMGGEHNALADAQWNKLTYEYLQKYPTGVFDRKIN